MEYKIDYDPQKLDTYIKDGYQIKQFVKPQDKSKKSNSDLETTDSRPVIQLYDQNEQFLNEKPSFVSSSSTICDISNSLSETSKKSESESVFALDTANKCDALSSNPMNQKDNRKTHVSYFSNTFDSFRHKRNLSNMLHHNTFTNKNEELNCTCEKCNKLYHENPCQRYCHFCSEIILQSHWSSHILSISHLYHTYHNVELDYYDSHNLTGVQPEYGISSSNIGYKMVKNMGWKENTGLGSNTQGIKQPIEAELKNNKYGLGNKKNQSNKKVEQKPKTKMVVYHRNGQQLSDKELQRYIKKAKERKDKERTERRGEWLRQEFKK